MESVVGILWRIIVKIEDDTDKLIAKTIYDDYSKNVFRDINSLAQFVNVSPSTITHFCKKYGFTGYQQLRERLKFDHERYIDKKLVNEINEESNKKFSIYNSIINEFFHEILNEENYINSLKSCVNEYKKLTVFVGSQLNSSVNFLVKLLNEKDIYCKKVLMAEVPFDNLHKYFLNINEPYLFILTGEENEMLYYILDKLDIKSYKNVFFITTTGQQERIKGVKNILILRSKIKYFNTFYRQIISQLLFLIMFDC